MHDCAEIGECRIHGPRFMWLLAFRVTSGRLRIGSGRAPHFDFGRLAGKLQAYAAGGAALLAVGLLGLLEPVAAQSYQSNMYPAGLHPSLCPHYPYCDNAVLGGFARDAAALQHGASHQQLAPGYPASLSPHACPNYPYCTHHIPAEAIHYKRHAGLPATAAAAAAAASEHNALRRSATLLARQYPSGVDPATCPHYPYCH